MSDVRKALEAAQLEMGSTEAERVVLAFLKAMPEFSVELITASAMDIKLWTPHRIVAAIEKDITE